jgi:uncharacterized membrane protein YbaN (DUF454 family)
VVRATRRLILRTLRITVGVILVLIGLAGGFVPIFQGWVFGIAGLGLLAKDIPWLRHRLRPLAARLRLCRRRMRHRRQRGRGVTEET